MTHEDVLGAITAERESQIECWGPEAFDFPGKPWLEILMEEIGEVAEARLCIRAAQQEGSQRSLQLHTDRLQEELIQVATVAAFWAEELKS